MNATAAVRSPQEVRKPRPRRVAADEAHSWARNLRLNNPFAKLVLSMLTIYVDMNGSCFVGIETLAEDTELSTDTVRKRLAWLEQVGAIARLPQWVDGSGRRNGEGRGKRTTDEIRLLLSADVENIELRALGHDPESSEPEKSGSADDGEDLALAGTIGQQTENVRNLPSVSPLPALCQPSDSGKGLDSFEPEPEPEDSPQPPASGGSEVGLEGWKEFQEAYPGPILRQSLAQTVWQALTPSEREIATRAARGYGLWLKAQRRPPNVLGAHLFLKERDAWAQYAGRSDAAHQRVIVKSDSVEARAYTNLRSLGGANRPVVASDDTVTLPHALSGAEMAFADPPPRNRWQFVSDRNQLAAWLGFFDEHLQGVNRRVIVEERQGVRGFLAPWQWPPNKDGGTIPWPEPKKEEATGPPDG